MGFTFRKFQAWQVAHELVLQVYKITRKFPAYEQYGLTSQLRRSAVSIAANIAEGYKKTSRKDFSRFIEISIGSLEETKYYLLLAGELGYLDEPTNVLMEKIYNSAGKLLHRLHARLKLPAAIPYPLHPIPHNQ